jgi:hypothetical protein
MWIAEIDAWSYRNRIYNQKLGRFLQTDPIGQAGGLNLYAYVGNDPVNWIDPWGLDGCRAVTIGHTHSGGGTTVYGICRPNYGYEQYVSEYDYWMNSFDGSGGPSGGGEPATPDEPTINACPDVPRVSIGFGPSGTIFVWGVGVSAALTGNVSIPGTPGSFRGTQLSATGSITPLIGFGGFLGAGPSASFNYTEGGPAPWLSTASDTVVQVAAAKAIGLEVVSAVFKFPDWSGSGARYGAGGYGALGQRLSGTLTTPELGCVR